MDEKRILDQYLTGLPTDHLADLLEQQLLYPDPVENDAFFLDHNVPRAAQAIDIVLRRVARRRRALKREHRPNPRQLRHMHRLELVASTERRALLRRLTSLQASPGRAQPTARRRALQRLADRHPKEFVQLVREEQANLELERRSARQSARGEIRQIQESAFGSHPPSE